MGRKDIIKIDGPIDLDFDMLAVLDPNITIDVITKAWWQRKHNLIVHIVYKHRVLLAVCQRHPVF